MPIVAGFPGILGSQNQVLVMLEKKNLDFQPFNVKISDLFELE